MFLQKKKTKLYETEVIEIGEEAKNFKEIKMVILFGEGAPDLSLIHI